MEQNTNKRWYIDEAGNLASSDLLPDKLKKETTRASKLLAKGNENMLGCVCWQCHEAGKVFLTKEEKYRKVILYCHSCGRYYFDRIDITDYEKVTTTP